MNTTITATRTTRELWYQHTMMITMKEDPELSNLGRYLKSAGVNTIDQLLNFPTRDLNKSWEYTDGASTQTVPFMTKQVIHIFQSFYAAICIENGVLVDPTTIDLSNFDNFCI